MELKIKLVQGTFINFAKLSVDDGYCFYDVDEPETERSYMTDLTTPVINMLELRRKYIVVAGDADKLNEEVHNVELQRH